MHFVRQSITAKVENSIATIELKQVFVNELEDPIEATYSFPTDPDIVVSKLVFKLGDKEVIGKVKDKEQAKENYDDAIAGGNAAVLLEEESKDKDLLKMTIGGIQKDQEVHVTVTLIK